MGTLADRPGSYDPRYGASASVVHTFYFASAVNLKLVAQCQFVCATIELSHVEAQGDEEAFVYLKRVGASRLPSKQSEHFN